MRSGLPVLFRLLRLTLFHSKGSPARFTRRRLLIMCIYIPLLLFEQTLHRIGFLLDEIFFRGYRKIEIKEPVFVLGIPRSGTTFLHRVLARDTERFTTFKLWELVYAPSITQRKFWMAVGAVDRALGGRGRRWVEALEERAFKRWREIHRISLFQPEEDEWVLMHVFSCVFLLWPFPFPEELWYLVRFDVDTPPADKERIMAFYKSCVQRHLYVHGADKRFLSKNPAFSPKVDALNQWFPDAKAVCCVRTPYDAVPSLMSLMAAVWDFLDNDRQGEVLRDMVVDVADHWYRHPMNRLPKWPEDRHAFVTYDTLVGDPKQTVADLYDRFGIEVSPAYHACLQREQERARAYTSKHTYSLDQYDLTPEGILDDFRDVFEHFGFSTAYPDQAETETREGAGELGQAAGAGP